MNKVTAKGTRDGKEILVEGVFANSKLELTFNKERDFWLEGIIMEGMKEHPLIGGTYYPETEKLNLVAVLESLFFDYSPEIEIERDIEKIPYEEGRVY